MRMDLTVMHSSRPRHSCILPSIGNQIFGRRVAAMLVVLDRGCTTGEVWGPDRREPSESWTGARRYFILVPPSHIPATRKTQYIPLPLAVSSPLLHVLRIPPRSCITSSAVPSLTLKPSGSSAQQAT